MFTDCLPAAACNGFYSLSSHDRVFQQKPHKLKEYYVVITNLGINVYTPGS